MRIEYLHASRFGNGAEVADEFARRMAARGVTVNVHHIRDVAPDRLPPADLYVFSSPGQWGRPIRRVRRFLNQVVLPAGTPYALLTTEVGPPQPDKETGRIPTEEEIAKYQRVRPMINELLQGVGLVNVAEERIYVTGIKGPLEPGWRDEVEAFAARIPLTLGSSGG
jgi:menaquinone-dependent protoporphyrinogen IX oxidase